MTEDTRKTVFLVAAVVVMTGIPALILVPWDQMAAQSAQRISLAAVIGNLLGPVGGLAAFSALIFNIIATNRTFDETRRTQVVANFQKGAEMLVDATEAKANAAVVVLEQVAIDSPATVASVNSTLESFASERESNKWKAARTHFEGDVEDCPDTSGSSLRAIQTISKLHFPLTSDLYSINRPYFARWNFPDATLGRLQLRNARIHHFTFLRASFVQSYMYGQVGKSVVFRGGFYGGARFELSDLDGRMLQPEDWQKLAFVEVRPEDAVGFIVNDIPFEDWDGRARVAIASR